MAKDKDRNKRAVRDQAGVGPEPRETRHLTPMKELKRMRIAGGEPDIRGWSVFSSSGREFGKVEDLLVDSGRGEVVMMDIDLRDTDRHSLAPIRAAWIDRDNKRVVLDGAQFDATEEIPSLRRGEVSDEEARAFGDSYARTYGDRGFAHDRDYQVAKGDSGFRFGRRRPDRDDESTYVVERRDERRPPELARESVERDDEADVRYASRGDDEQVIRSRPVVVEETVVRRRVVDESEMTGGSTEERRGSRPGDDDVRERR